MENLLSPTLNTSLYDDSHDLIASIQTASGLSDRQFSALCEPALRAYADYVQMLPFAREAYGHRKGAWEFGLNASMVAYRYASTVIFFPNLGSEERRNLEPQCRYMAFVATLATALARTLSSCAVSTDDDEYHPLCADSTLYAWLSTHTESARFAWRTSPDVIFPQIYGGITAKFIPRGLLKSFDVRAVLMLYEAVTPKTTIHGVEGSLTKVVRESMEKVFEHAKSKQTLTYQESVAPPNITAAESEIIANRMSAHGNPTIPENPLAPRPAASSVVHQVAAPAPVTQPEVSAPTQLAKSSVVTVPPVETAPAPAPAPVRQVVNAQIAPAGGDILAKANKVLIEWFRSLQEHPNYALLKGQLTVTPEGITVPVAMLGMFGVSAPAIRSMMSEAGLIVRRSDDARGVILHPDLVPKFIPAEQES